MAVLGGTFDRLHAGHLALLDTAFQNADRVGIGVTTDGFLRAHPKPESARIQPYADRRAALERVLRRRYPGATFWLSPLQDEFGRSLEPGIDLLIVSAETLAGARRVNAERRRRRLPSLRVLRVPLVLGEDRLPISSRRIRSGEVDARGRRRSPLRIGVYVSGSRVLTPAVRSAVRTAIPGVLTRITVHVRASATPRPRSATREAQQAALDRNEMGFGLVYRPDGSWSVALAAVGLPLRAVYRVRPRRGSVLPSLGELLR